MNRQKWDSFENQLRAFELGLQNKRYSAIQGEFLFWTKDEIRIIVKAEFYGCSIEDQDKFDESILIGFHIRQKTVPQNTKKYVDQTRSEVYTKIYDSGMQALFKTSDETTVEFFSCRHSPIGSIIVKNIDYIRHSDRTSIVVTEIPLIYNSSREQLARLDKLHLRGYTSKK